MVGVNIKTAACSWKESIDSRNCDRLSDPAGHNEAKISYKSKSCNIRWYVHINTDI